MHNYYHPLSAKWMSSSCVTTSGKFHYTLLRRWVWKRPIMSEHYFNKELCPHVSTERPTVVSGPGTENNVITLLKKV